MGKTTIEWCDFTFNPWRGCTPIGAGCANCYARRMARRQPAKFGVWARNERRIVSRLTLPWQWNRRAIRLGTRYKVFVGSMCDWAEDYRPVDAGGEVIRAWQNEVYDARSRLWAMIEACRNLDFLLLTKRVSRIAKVLPLSWVCRPRPNVWLGASVSTQSDADRAAEFLRQSSSSSGASGLRSNSRRRWFVPATGRWRG